MSTTLLYEDSFFLNHDTGKHVECAERLGQIHQMLSESNLPSRCGKVAWEKAEMEALLRIHTPGYLAHLEQFTDRGGGRLEQDTIVSPQSFAVARYASGAACDAVSRVVQGDARSAFCLIRPPGHHAIGDSAMGFCLLNHVAVAAAHARAAADVERVLIVDWDVHHGNGTQDIFWEDSQVAFLSIHRWPFYPGTGRAEETGSGRGRGTTRNIPLPLGTSRTSYLDQFRRGLELLAAKHRPELILLSAGFDAHQEDPIGSLGLTDEDFEILTRCVLDVAAVHCGGRVVSLLEGGYNPQALARCAKIHLNALLEDGD